MGTRYHHPRNPQWAVWLLVGSLLVAAGYYALDALFG